ncbi:DUF444 family protein [Flammeovirga yaeyamensis]|uniref:UPF0229 protein KMW28_15275 n=1 Tax=Flammeovirga yaeyamensis TaxID=367791 RepID=A0AAX1N4M8_9BACT|nr:DUF444 family protein [Flammeovirga yaeyamensis]MBB3698629.1 hypothetical protein [Flammeovirga yaeyamensis]NMF34024.1 DUF444 family protein [Flammeovirga yaeyamensis]QWG01012.1 DUF444 family protein [Flammeovirga yaeyamensis]
MAIFKEFSKQKRDRSAADRQRHKELVKEKIKKGISDVIANESIIGQDKDKKIKVPIRGIKEFRFVYGNNKGKGAATGTGKEQKGQVIQDQRGQPQKGQGKGEAGSDPGEDIYETEITLEEAIQLMFEDLELPDMDQKKYFQTDTEVMRKLLGYQKKGIRARLSKRKTMMNRIKRMKAKGLDSAALSDTNESFPFHNDDLVYRRLQVDTEEHSNAVVLCLMDTSGSMDQTKKYLARSFYFMLYTFLQTRYENTEILFIAHHTEAKEVTEDEFFHKGESGGTIISSAYIKALEIIEERYNPMLWNIYAFHCSDGDNFTSDNKKAIEHAEKLSQVCNLFGYGEIKPDIGFSWSTMLDEYKKIEEENFVSLRMRTKESVWPALKKFLTKDKSNTLMD